MAKESSILQRRHWGVEGGYNSIFPREMDDLIKNALAAERVIQIDKASAEESGAMLACEASQRVFASAMSINGHDYILDREVWAGIIDGLMGEMKEWATESIVYGEQNTSRYIGFQNKLRSIFERIVGSDNRKYHPDHNPSPLMHWDVVALLASDLNTMAGCTSNTFHRWGRMNLYDQMIRHRKEKTREFTRTEKPEIQGIVISAINAGSLPDLGIDQKKEYIDGVNTGLTYLFPHYYLDLKV